MLDQLDWRWMFWLALPIAVVSLAAGAAWVRNVTEPVDVLSVVLSALAFAGLMYGLSSIGRTFATRTFTVAVVLVAVSMMALFGTLILLPIYLQTGPVRRCSSPG